MENRITGAILCLASAILFAARNLSAAIFMSSVQSWDRELFASSLSYVGVKLEILGSILLIAGILYLIWPEVKKIIVTRRKKED